METCANCGQEMPDGAAYDVTDLKHDTRVSEFCSLACLIEWAWAQREAQPKLSKSHAS